MRFSSFHPSNTGVEGSAPSSIGTIGNAGTPTITASTTVSRDGVVKVYMSGSWAGVADAVSYDVEIGNGTTWVVSSPVASLTDFEMVVNPTSPLTYRIRVKGVNRNGLRSADWSTYSNSIVAEGDVTAPGVPTGVAVTRDGSSAVLTWTNPTDRDLSYVEVRHALSNNVSASTVIGRIAGTTFTHAKLTEGTTNYYWVRGLDNSSNAGDYAGVVSVVMPAVFYDTVPTNVSGTPTLSYITSMLLDGTAISTLSGSWTAVPNAAGYLVEITNTTTSVSWTITAPSEAITNIPVTTGNSYNIKVKAVNSVEVASPAWSTTSATVTAAGDVTPPGIVTGVTAVTTDFSSILLNWTNPTDRDFSYVEIDHSLDNTTFTLIGRVSGTTFIHAKRAEGTTNYYRLRAFDYSANAGTYSSPVFVVMPTVFYDTTPGTVSGTPTVSTVSRIGPDGTESSVLEAAWTSMSTAKYYDIEVTNVTDSISWIVFSSTNSIKNIPVIAGKSYYVRVKGVNSIEVRSASWSAASSTIAVGGDLTAPGPITGLTVSASGTKFTFNWTDPTAPDFSYIKIYGGTSTATFNSSTVYKKWVAPGGGPHIFEHSRGGLDTYFWIVAVDNSGNESTAVASGQITAPSVSLFVPWHPDNDGPGSGLNADLFDDYDSTEFPRKAEAATITSAWTFAAGITLNNPAATAHGINWTNAGVFDAGITHTPSSGEFKFNVGRNSSWGGFMTFMTDTIERMRISASGNVGIGTASPQQKFVVTGGANGFEFVPGATASTSTLQVYDRVAGSYGSLNIDATTFNVRISGSATPAFYINTSRNTGIGTLTPQYKLDVNQGTTGFQASFGTEFGSGAFAGIHFGYSEATNALYRKSAIVFERSDSGFGDARGKIHILNATSGSASATLADSRLTIDAYGNIGIGTTSPNGRLTLGGLGGSNPNEGVEVEYSNALVFQYLNFYQLAAIKTIQRNGYYVDAADLAFSTSWGSLSERMRIRGDNGNIGIGTSSPAQRLHVSGGALRLDHPSDRAMEFIRSGANSFTVEHDTYRIYFYNASTSAVMLSFTNGGNVGVGNASPSQKLHVSGNILASGTVQTTALYNTEWNRSQTDYGYIDFGPANAGHAHIYTDRPTFYFNRELQVNGATVWNSGNDGASSGLDADLLDGLHASAFGQLSSNNTWAGTQVYTGGNAISIRHDSGYMDWYNGAQTTRRGYIQHYGTWLFQNEVSGGNTTINTTGGGLVYINGHLAWHSGNDGVGSGLDANLLNGLTQAQLDTRNMEVVSQRDFVDGTLITTNINYATSSGDPFVLEISGNSYFDRIPHRSIYQGYIYDNTMIATGGISSGRYITGIVLMNVGGNLCFWFPRQGYWHGYSIRCYVPHASTNAAPLNRVTAVTDVVKPSGTKEVDLNTYTAQAWHNLNDGAGSGLDADLLDGVNSDGFMQLAGVQTASGRKTFSSSAGTIAGDFYANSYVNSALEVFNGNGNRGAYMSFHITGIAGVKFGLNTNAWLATDATGIQVNGNTVWHAGNDGAGTGLDADLLDGLHAVSFAKTIDTAAWTTSPGNDANVARNIRWTRYGGGHVIFDASEGISPSGGAVSKTNPQEVWAENYPTWMGWNGTSTYGVRVDRARYAELHSTGNALWHAGDFAISQSATANTVAVRDSVGYLTANWFNSLSGGMFSTVSGVHWNIGGASQGAALMTNTTAARIRMYTAGGVERASLYADDGGAFGFLSSNGAWKLQVGQEGSGTTAIRGAPTWVSILFQTQDGTNRGQAYADSSNNIGFINNDGNWALQVPKTGNPTIRVSGTLQEIWTAANFNPATKANLSGDTFTGNVWTSNGGEFRVLEANVSRANQVYFGADGDGGFIHSTYGSGGTSAFRVICEGSLRLHINTARTFAHGELRTPRVQYDTVRSGAVGIYDPNNTQAIWAMGSDYVLTAGGASNVIGNHYGLAWSYNPDYGGAGNNPTSKAGLNHQLLLQMAGVTYTALGNGIWTAGRIECAGSGGWTMGSYADKNRIDYDSTKFRFLNAANQNAAVEMGALTVQGAATFNSSATMANGTVYTSGGLIYSSNWWRSTGVTGWFNADYSTGIYCSQSLQVRTYNGGSFYSEGAITAVGNITGAEFYSGSGNYFRAGGTGGFYCQTYDGGWHMTDGTWLRSIANKGILTGGAIQGATVTATSDLRLKSEIRPLTNFSEVIDATNVYSFIKDGTRQWGVIAQEVLNTPAALLVREGGTMFRDGTPILTVDFAGFTYALLAEVKELRKRVAMLEAK